MKVNYVLDADIRGFFDNLDKSWLIKFVEHRVADPRILRLIPEMAERRGHGGRQMVGNQDRYPARVSDFADACQYLSALRGARINLVLPTGEIPVPIRGAAASPGIESWV